jgi:hypothetical protein
MREGHGGLGIFDGVGLASADEIVLPLTGDRGAVPGDADSQTAIACSDRQNDEKRLTTTVRSPRPGPGTRTATQITFLCTSIPATRGWTTSIRTSCP